MKLTNREIDMAKKPLEALMMEPLPMKVAYELVQLLTKLDVQLGVIQKVREGLFRTYGKPVEGEPQKLKVEMGTPEFVKFTEEMNELMRQEFEFVYSPVTLPDTLVIQPGNLMMLGKLVKV